MSKTPYRDLAVMTAISAVFMFAAMYLMVDRLDRVLFNLNTFYMTVAMAAPMVVIMLLTMRQMYPNGRLNAVIHAVSLLAFVGSIALVRTQTTIGDRAFLTSMIPHHAGAVLMCERARLTNPELVSLCARIVKSQNQEIAQMQAMLANNRR